MNKKFIMAIGLCLVIIISQAFVKTEKQKEEKPHNLKVLPSDISNEDLMNIMKTYSRSLGVHCNHCHEVIKEGTATEHPEMDFASDKKPEKITARQMMKMTEAINSKYLEKMNTPDYKLEQVACVTCHMGKMVPTVSIDSLPKMPRNMPPGPPPAH